MADVQTSSEAFVFFLLLVVVGRVLRWGQLLTKPEAHTLSKVIVHCTIPSLALDSLSSHNLCTWKFASLPLMCIVHSTIMGLIAYAVFRHEDVRMRALLMISSLGYGIGQFAYPLLLASYGSAGLLYAMLFDAGNFLITFGFAYAYCIYLDEVHCLKANRSRKSSKDSYTAIADDGAVPAPFTSPGLIPIPENSPGSVGGSAVGGRGPAASPGSVGGRTRMGMDLPGQDVRWHEVDASPEAYMERVTSFDSVLSVVLIRTREDELLMSVIGKRIALRVLTFTPILALIVGASFSFLQVPLPQGVHDFCKMIGAANGPLVGLMLGVSLEFRISRDKWRWVTKVLVLRYSISAISAVICYRFTDYGADYRSVVVTCLLLPPPLVILPYALDFGLDAELAGMVITTTIIISFVIMFFVKEFYDAGVM